MSEGFNRWLGLGNLCADPELRTTNSGQAVLKMRLACSERYQDRDKQWQERVEYVSVVVWNRRAEALSKFLAKGSRLFVSMAQLRGPQGKRQRKAHQAASGDKAPRPGLVLRRL